jgi:hypothetical protein
MQNTNLNKDAAVQLRLGSLFAEVEEWRRNQPKIPYRAEAVRELLRRGLDTERRDRARDVRLP